jgi:hypothetical protein
MVYKSRHVLLHAESNNGRSYYWPIYTLSMFEGLSSMTFANAVIVGGLITLHMNYSIYSSQYLFSILLCAAYVYY